MYVAHAVANSISQGVTDQSLMECREALEWSEPWQITVDSTFTDDGLRQLAQMKGCEQLAELGLLNSAISDAGLEEVAKLPRLRLLSASNCTITDEGLKHLVGMQDLEVLELDGTAITATGLATLQQLPALNKLYVRGCNISPTDLRRFELDNQDIRIVR